MHLYGSRVRGEGLCRDQDQEISFAVPSSDFERLMAGLEYIGQKGAYRYPVPNLSALSEPKIPQNYFQIAPAAG